MLLRLAGRCRVPVRLDSVAGGVQTGHKISAVYFVGRCTTEGAAAQQGNLSAAAVTGAASAGGQLRLQNIEVAAPLAGGLIGDSDGSVGSSGGSPVAASPREGGDKDSKHGGNNGGNSSCSTDGESMPAGSSCPPVPPRGGGEKGPLPPSPPRQGVVLEPTADRLVLFRSDCVSTETLEVSGHHGQEQYAVLFWMHGAKDGAGEATAGGGAAQSPTSS